MNEYEAVSALKEEKFRYNKATEGAKVCVTKIVAVHSGKEENEIKAVCRHFISHHTLEFARSLAGLSQQ